MTNARARPHVAPDIDQVVPMLLQQQPRWVTWRAGQPDARGKFTKTPVDPNTRRSINALDRSNWRSFDQAIEAVRLGNADGIGIVLDREVPVLVDGQPYTLTAVDLDQCEDHLLEHREAKTILPPTYCEKSPSLKGIRIMGLSRTAVRSGNAKLGRELYSTKRFMTITGFQGAGQLADITDGVVALEQKWFPAPKLPQIPTAMSVSTPPVLAETPENFRAVLDMLSHVSSDIEYDRWRNICWSIASTGWRLANAIAQKWSATATLRYDAVAVDRVMNDFDPSRGISLGTLVFEARKLGWSGVLPWNSGVVGGEGNFDTSAQVKSSLLTSRELQALPRTQYLVRGVLPERGLAAIYGAPSSGKSFLALDLAHAITTERSDWFGHPVRKAPVAYLALEGQGGISRRTKALEAHTRTMCPDSLRFHCGEYSLLERGETEGLASVITAQLGPGTVVIVDTLNQASPGADENSSQDMGRVIANAKWLAEAIRGLVILVHHAGKDHSKGLRGHSSLLASLDVAIEVRKTSSGRTWGLAKAKDDTSHLIFDFELKVYEVDEDEFGPITSCAVSQTINQKSARPGKPIGKHQVRALEVLSSELKGRAISREEAISHVAPQLDVDARARDRAAEAIAGLIARGNLVEIEGGCISTPLPLPNPNPIGGFGFSGTGATPKLPVSGHSGGDALSPLTTSENWHV